MLCVFAVAKSRKESPRTEHRIDTTDGQSLLRGLFFFIGSSEMAGRAQFGAEAADDKKAKAGRAHSAEAKAQAGAQATP